jgi:hypothetical protein
MLKTHMDRERVKLGVGNLWHAYHSVAWEGNFNWNSYPDTEWQKCGMSQAMSSSDHEVRPVHDLYQPLY